MELLLLCVLNGCSLASYGVDLVAGQQLAFPLEWTSLREEEEEGAWSSGRGSETVLVLIYSHTLVLYSGYI